ncbi:MAG: O-antigen ligase family protein [Isosphaeraceae bacterium]
MSFALFLMVNAMLFIRPAEFHPALLGLPIYEVCILACLASAYQRVLAEVQPARLIARPVNACAVAMVPAIVIATVANGDPARAFEAGLDFVKLLIYFFLLVSVVDTPRRLSTFLGWIGVFALVITTLAVLHYHGIVNVPALHFVEDGIDDDGNTDSTFRRLGSTGLFQDPNDMCLMLVMAMTICLYQMLEHRRWYWLPPLFLFGHALMLTHSRGGFLAMLLALGILLLARFGRKALPLGLVVIPGVLVLFAGRQTSFGSALSGSGTGLSRLQLWHEGLLLFIRTPLYGIGVDRYAEEVGHVAHNSFIHCYVELGLIGGTIFLGAFYLAFWPLVRLGGRAVPSVLLGEELTRLRPYLMAIVGGYAGGLLSLSCPYTIPTYTVLGLASVYQSLSEEKLGVPLVRINTPLLQRVAILSGTVVVGLVLGVRLLARVG